MKPRLCVSAFPPCGAFGFPVLVVLAHVGLLVSYLVRACLASIFGLHGSDHGHGARGARRGLSLNVSALAFRM
ncbi:hypothetical protein BJX65DRAFT_279146 [Aspergillus insuetus]